MRDLSILKNYLLYILTGILICMVGISNVFAWTNWNGITYDNLGMITNQTGIMIDVSYETNAGAPLSVSADQTVYTQIKKLYINVDNYNFSANTRYELELSLPNMQLNNNANTYIVTGNNGETCLVSYTDSIFVDAYPRWDFQCPTSTNHLSIAIFNSNNQSITDMNYFSWHYSYLYSSVTPITNSGTNNNNDLITNANQNADRIINNQNQNTQNIINNQDQNAQDIIDNQDQNSQDIINNQNQNTQDLIDSNKVCKTIDKNSIISNGYINSSGNVGSSNTYGVTDFLKIQSSDIKVLNSYSAYYFCFYDVNQTKLSCTQSNTVSDNDRIDIPTNSEYVRFTINKSVNKPQYQICTNGNQALTDTLTDDDIGSSTQDVADFITDFNTNTFGLTSIITAPLNLIQSLTSSSCSTLHLPLPYLNNKYLDLPCMTTIYQTHFGAFFTMYQTITYGIIAYWVIVRIFNQVKDFKNPEHDEIEVVDL